jgi:hypothetical protein
VIGRIVSGVVIWAGCVLAALLGLAWMLPALIVNSPRFWDVALGFDCTASALFGGDGKTTISKRAGLARRAGKRWGCVLCKLLDAIQANHCEDAAGGVRG